MTVRPQLGLTAWLAIFTLGTVVPLLLFAGFSLRSVHRTSRALADRGQTDTTRALALAVEGAVHEWRAALGTLASSTSLRQGRWAEFYEEARAVATRYEGWVVLHMAAGPQRMNTLRPFGAPLPETAASDMVQAVFREGKPLTDMTFGAVAQRYIISNSVPVFRDGKVLFCLSLNFAPERLTRLLESQQLPKTWVAALNDSHRRVVARSSDAEARVGMPVVDWFAAATRASESGMATGPMIDGRLAQIAFERVKEVPWVVALAIPVAELQAAVPFWGFTSIGVFLSLVALGMALYMGRTMTEPVRRLAHASGGLLRGQASDVSPPSGIREVQELQHALAHASAAARAHIEEREQAAAALRKANEELERRVAERTAALVTANEALRVANEDLQNQIAQRRRAEENVRTIARFPSENPNPVLRLDTEGRILYANPAAAPILEQWGAKVESRAPEPWLDTVRSALTSNTGTATEFPCGHRTYLVHVVPIPEAGYVNLYMSDISKRKHAEEAVETARADAVNERNRLVAVLQALPVGMALVDAQGGTTRANAAFEEIWGGPRPATQTVADYATYKAQWADSGRPVQPEEWASAQAVQHKRAVIGQLLQIQRFDGARRFVLNSAAPILDAEGEVIGAAVTIQDITEFRNAQEALRRSEALYRGIGESIDYGVWVCDAKGRNTYASESFLTLVGLTQQQCSDFGWGAVLHPDDADRTIAAWKECVRTGEIWDIEHRFRGVDGQWHDVLARGVPVKDDTGEVLCWAGINLDISRLKRAEAALRLLNTDLERRVTVRTTELAHAVQTLERQAIDLRTLATELTLAEQRERRRLADVLHDELQQLLVATRLRAFMLGRAAEPAIQEAAQEIVALIEEALAHTRSLTGELSPPTLQKGGLLPALEWLARWVAEKHRLTVRLTPPPAPMPPLPEDTCILLYQAVRECLLNTVKYAKTSEATVTVAVADAALIVSVADAGIGFDPTRLRVAGGPDGGVGLLGIRERLEWVGGHLEIASAPGQGSRLTLVAPLGQAAAPPMPLPVVAPPDAEPRVNAGRRLRVLIVDDHALVRRGVATLLAGEPDLEVVGEADNGQQAVQLTRQAAPDVVLMDVSMPVINGIDATRIIHAEWPTIRVIGLSVFDDPEQPEAMRQAGAAGYLRKSDSTEALLAAIRGGVAGR